jgi:uncharacterized protein YndB with AHSA1/START domain
MAEACKPIEDSITIKAAPERVFKALTDGDELGHWWPMSAVSDPRLGGKLKLTWFTDHSMDTAFDVFDPPRKVAYPFYIERVEFELTPENGKTRVLIRHHCTKESEIHVAQSWGFLKANLKTWIEHGIDLRQD